ncbi:MAG: glycosyltransferase family 1 protein, partial [Actinomycetota bacterium]|nr:glycosyltransferase family 1 protein [Actinomycetota bacterium]
MTEPGADTGVPTVAVFGDVDINLIDGSSIWLVSLCSVLDRLDLRGHVLLKATIDRDVLSRELDDLSHFRVWAPGDVGVSGRLRPGALVGAVAHIDESESLDIVIVRGLRASTELAASGRFDGRLWPYLTDIPQSAEEMTAERQEDLRRIFDVSGRILCQTESLRSFLVSYFPDHDARMILLPPMVPDSAFRVHREDADPGVLRLFYAGKFAPQWG